MGNQIIVRQRVNPTAKHYGLDKEGVSVHPSTNHKLSVNKESGSNKFLTGLDPESRDLNKIQNDSLRKKEKDRIQKELTRLSKEMNVDLSPHKDNQFWLDLEIPVVEKGKKETVWEKDNPLHMIYFYAAVASRLVAPSEDDLYHPSYLQAQYYIFDPESHTSKAQQLQDIKDDVAVLMATYRTNRDKLFYLASALHIPVNRNLREGDLSNLINTYRNNLKTYEDFERFKLVLDLDNSTLLVKYYVETAFKQKLFKKEGDYWAFYGKALGTTKDECISELQLPNNQEYLQLLQEHIDGK